jgi:hypothetical protein
VAYNLERRRVPLTFLTKKENEMKKIKMTFVTSTILVLGLGCDTRKEYVSVPQAVNAPASPKAPSLPTPPKVTDLGVAFQVVEPNVPNQYQIYISWPKELKSVFIEDFGRNVFVANQVQRDFLYTLRDNTSYSLRVFQNTDTGARLVGEYKGRMPNDYVFSTNVNLERDLTVDVHRVFFTNEAKVQTNGFKLNIKADKVYSENAEIFSFPRGQKAELMMKGRNGGSLKLVSTEASGTLRITMRGEHGGDGIDGSPFQTRAADGGQGSAGAHDCARALGRIVRCWCTSSPGPGNPGADGADGRPGADAGKGGNSGSVAVDIKAEQNFRLNVQQEAGVSGTPGQGAEGQEGGIGGAPGNPTSDACGGSHPGQNGKRGKSGKSGDRPSDGEIEKKCISIGQDVRDC